MFSVYVDDPYEVEGWRTLVHVCRRWRTLVFESPHHLNLQLSCSVRTPLPAKLDVWPALPIVVQHNYGQKRNLDNLIAAIKHNDRVCKIEFRTFFDISQLEEVVSVMQVPFPALTDLKLVFNEEVFYREVYSYEGVFETASMVIPDSFLGGSAPRLQRLYLQGISFPGLPKLLLSTTNLVSLQLRDLPHSCYISPDTIVTCLSASARLKSFSLEYESPRSPQDWESRHLPPVPPPTRNLLPVLTMLRFKGFHEYAEDLMTRIDTPLLRRLHITFFNETIANLPHLSQFINCIRKFQALDEARVLFSEDEVRVTLPLSIGTIGFEGLVLKTSWDGSVGLLEILDRLCRPLLPTLARVEQLYIHGDDRPLSMSWSEGIQPSHWLEFLHSFTGAKYFYLGEDLAPCILPVLGQLVGERTAEVLPALQNLFIYELWNQGDVRGDIEKFVAARQLSGHPINYNIPAVPVGS
jgi:hypothetical protein